MKNKDPKVVEEIFEKISSKYDFLNDFLSFGLHRLWKRQFLAWLKPLSGEKWLDLCCGTGDLTFLLAKLVAPTGSVLGIDFSESQVLLAKKRFVSNTHISMSWLIKDVLQNDLPTSSFDGIIMAYGLRNLSDPEAGLKEIHRLLKPGGKAGVLDFNRSQDSSKTFWFQKFYLRTFVVPIASIFGLREQYAYIEESLINFPSASGQKKIALKIGFKAIDYKFLAGGQMGALLVEK